MAKELRVYEIDEINPAWSLYDQAVAENHLSMWDHIYVDTEFFEPIDYEFFDPNDTEYVKVLRLDESIEDERREKDALMHVLDEFANDVYEYLDKNGISGLDIYEYGYQSIEYSGKVIGGTVSIEIDGDWEHDHLRADSLLEKKHIYLIDRFVIEDTGSGLYKAVHVYDVPKEITAKYIEKLKQPEDQDVDRSNRTYTTFKILDEDYKDEFEARSKLPEIKVDEFMPWSDAWEFSNELAEKWVDDPSIKYIPSRLIREVNLSVITPEKAIELIDKDLSRDDKISYYAEDIMNYLDENNFTEYVEKRSDAELAAIYGYGTGRYNGD